MTLKRILVPLTIGAAIVLPVSSMAQMVFPSTVTRPAPQEDTGLLYKAGLGVQSVDNIYGTASGQVSDIITTESLGMSLKTSFGGQSLALDAGVSNNQYQSHSELNYLGTLLGGTWQWNSGSSLFGSVTGSQVVTQNMIGTSVNTTQRNLNTTEYGNALVGYDFGGGWQATTGVLSYSSVNEQLVYGQALNLQYSGAYAGAAYVFASGNTVSLRTLTGTGTNVYDFGVFANEFRLDGDTGAGTTYNVLLTYWQQNYASQSAYNFSGLEGRAALTWVPTEKTSLQLTAQRQLYGVVFTNATYTVNDSISINPSWQITPKLALKANFQELAIRFEGDPGSGPSGEVDYFQTMILGLYWQPRENATIILSTNQTVHTTNLNSSSIGINTISLTGTIVF